MSNLRFAVTFALLGLGLWGVGDAYLHSQPRKMTCEEFVSSQIESDPDQPQSPFSGKDWLELVGCELEVAEMTYERTPVLRRAKKVFIPIRPLSSSDEAMTHLLLRSTSKADLQLAESLGKLGSDPKMQSSEAHKALPSEELAHLQTRSNQHAVRGMIRRDVGLIEGLKLGQKDERLARGFVVIDEGAIPSILPAIVLLVSGLALAALSFLPAFMKNTKNPDGPLSSHSGPTPPPLR
jgi:hypothetical protein